MTGLCRKSTSASGKGKGAERSQRCLLCSDSPALLVGEASSCTVRETCDEGSSSCNRAAAWEKEKKYSQWLEVQILALQGLDLDGRYMFDNPILIHPMLSSSDCEEHDSEGYKEFWFVADTISVQYKYSCIHCKCITLLKQLILIKSIQMERHLKHF